MAAGRRVPPGRAGIMWLRHRLGVAEHGADLLRRKLTMLVHEQDRLHRERAAASAAWAEADRTARTWLARAVAVDGDRAVELAADPAPAQIVPQWTTLMGVRYAVAPAVDLPPASGGRHVPGGPALAHAIDGYRAAALAAAVSAAATAAAATVDEEVRGTRQRVRALDRHWIPWLRGALAAAQLQLDELENADIVRRRRAGGDRHGIRE